jgi:hypothetical protein
LPEARKRRERDETALRAVARQPFDFGPQQEPRLSLLVIYGSRRAAENALRAVLRDEPSWAGDISVLELPLAAFPLGTPSLN